MIPRAKIEALLNAPPRKVSSKPKMPPALCCNFDGSIPGSTTKEPNLKIIKKNTVLIILSLSSSIEKIFLIVSNSLIINQFLNFSS